MDLTGRAVDDARLRRLLGTPETAWIVERARRRLEREEPLTGPVSLAGPSDAQRAAAERLLGRAPGRGRSLTVRLDVVDGILRRSGISPDGLAPAVVALTGAVSPVRELRAREAQSWARAYAVLAPLDDGPLAAWARRLREDGTIRRLAREPERAHELLSAVVPAVLSLPCEPAVSLQAFAALHLGGAHRLDEGTPHATLLLSAVRALTGHPDGTGAAWRRAAWASAGLLRDDVSSTVLTLNLRGTPALDFLADTGEPAVLTLRQLARLPGLSAPDAGDRVRICENPAVLSAAADAHGPGCQALICVQGQPSTAAVTLLRRLHAQGTSLLYHGDFDWGGLRIASGLLRQVPWTPWRYRADDYRKAVAGSNGPRLTGSSAQSPWDPELALALTESGVRVEEEAVLEDLLADLAGGA
ncbi:TIGR02679 family protein [Streptomyces sp. NPDC005794]|uniref:TIGR02679 family protein n=1 Tax=Streptomyces sp. NPDC005794 TaxID=3364733 RepID=UPI003695AB51